MAQKFPDDIMKRLRQRNGLDEKDTSHDDLINTFSPRAAFRQVVAWELGHPSWADSIEYWLNSCGLEIKEKE